jgi:hypothetical protein
MLTVSILGLFFNIIQMKILDVEPAPTLSQIAVSPKLGDGEDRE